MKIAYFDCFAGASGDMILGALLDAGLSLEALVAHLQKLPLEGYRLCAEKAKRGPLQGTQVRVEFTADEEHRSLGEVLKIIGASSLSPEVKGQGEAVFRRLAAAEAKVHSLQVEEVRLHEVGDMDALIDVMGAIIGFDLLHIERLFSSPLPYGEGMVKTPQGLLPIPAPATLELLALAKAPLRSGPPGEAVTPTAAALLTTLASFQRPALALERVGYGVGSRELPQLPNVLRLWIGEEMAQEMGELLLLEANIDDMNPQLYGYVQERLFQEGARDVWFTPIQMKKNRPAVMLSVLAPPEAEGVMVETILRETSTLGLRAQAVRRHEAEREVIQVETSLGTVAVKRKGFHGHNLGLAPEYEDCRRLALKHGLPLQEVYRVVLSEAGLLEKKAPS